MICSLDGSEDMVGEGGADMAGSMPSNHMAVTDHGAILNTATTKASGYCHPSLIIVCRTWEHRLGTENNCLFVRVLSLTATFNCLDCLDTQQ